MCREELIEERGEGKIMQKLNSVNTESIQFNEYDEIILRRREAICNVPSR